MRVRVFFPLGNSTNMKQRFNLRNVKPHSTRSTRGTGNGKTGVDNRRGGARRIKALVREFTAALGGPGRLNIGEAESIRRIASLTVLVETQEALMVAGSGKYDPDLHVRTTSAIKRLIDDLDLPKKRKGTPTGNGDDPEYEDIPGESLEEFLEREAKKPGFGKPIPAASIGAAKRKRLRL